MANKTVEVKIPEELYAMIRAAGEKGIRRGRGEPVKMSVSELCALYVRTGYFRRKSANKWSRANAKDPSAKKTPAQKYVKVKRVGPKKAAPVKRTPAQIVNAALKKVGKPAKKQAGATKAQLAHRAGLAAKKKAGRSIGDAPKLESLPTGPVAPTAASPAPGESALD